MNIGNNIIKIRKEKGLTQEELASKINVSPKTISNYENNRSLPNIETLILLAKNLDTSIDNILGLNKENVNDINKKYHLANLKNSILKIIFISIILIIPIFYFISESIANFAHILAKYYSENTFEPINSAKAFDAFAMETAKIYLFYVIILLIIYILYLFKKKNILFIISGFLLVLFIYDLYNLGLDLIITQGIYNSSLLLSFIPSVISFILALKIKIK